MIDRKKDPVGYAEKVVGRDPFATLLGIKVEEAKDSYSRVSLLIREDYCNAEARAHGGVLFAVADQALAVAANSRGYPVFAIEVKINYLEAVRSGDMVTAEATAVDIRKRVSLWNIELTNQHGTKIAVAHGLGYHFV